MQDADNALKGVFLRLTSPQILTEVIAIVLAGLIALAGAHVVRTWHRNYLTRTSAVRQEVWQLRTLEGAVLLAPFMVALVVLLAVRWSLSIVTSIHPWAPSGSWIRRQVSYFLITRTGRSRR